ncbi:MAG: DUF6443 domain-containing protein [Spirosomataceae bacterium]
MLNIYRPAIVLIGLSLGFCAAALGQSSAQNYVTTRTYKQATTSLSTDVNVVTTGVDYFDGLGRLIQTVQVHTAPKTDGNGPKDVFLHTEYDSFGRTFKQYLPYPSYQNGAYRAEVPSEISGYYGNAANFEKDNPVNDDIRVSHETEYEKSPLGRVLKQYNPGPAVTNKDYVRFEYGLNVSNEVRRYDVSGSSLTDISYSNNYYNANVLTVVRSFDQNGNRTDEFKDKNGQVVLKRSFSTDNQILDTYYVYDNFGQLRAVLQPEFQQGTFSTTRLNLYAFLYEYNDRGLLTKKQTPGGGQTTITYDSRDRISTLTDANSVTITTNYDDLNRVTSTSQGGSDITTTKYDTYDSWTGLEFQSAEIPGLNSYVGAGVTSNRKGVVTSTEARVLGTGTMLRTVYYYDKKYRLIQTVRQLYNLGTNATEKRSILRDFAGKPLQELITQTTSYGKMITSKGYVYDQADRLLQTTHYVSKDDIPKTNIVLNALRYNEIGQLRRKYLHSEEYGNRFTERLEIKNNIQGWLRTMNGYSVSGQNFGIDLRYSKPLDGGTQQWNGNISELKWRQAGGTVQGYKFTYDGVNRLRAADGLGGFNNEEKGITYDLNGNLTALQRTSGGNTIDNLSYSYNGNRLSSINDISGYTQGQPNGTVNYNYDNNGNLTSYDSKTITYNILNLPSSVTGPANLTYTYTADGTKLEYYDGNSTTRYVGEMEYNQSNALTRIATADGQVAVSGDTYTYHYYLTDHLGNVRTIIDRTATVLLETDYYPFGLSIDRSGSTPNKYRFNGKEQQSVTGWLDFGARMYLPQIGRWGGVDTKSEKYLSSSPYNYTDNNPISRVDPTGKDWFYYQAKGEEKKGWHWQEGDVAKYTNTKGKEVTLKKGFDYLVTFRATGKNSEGASTGTLQLWGDRDPKKGALITATGFTGGSGFNATKSGNYLMDLSKRDSKGPQKMNSNKDNPVAFMGIQDIPNRYIREGNLGYDVGGAYGSGRIRLLETDGEVNRNSEQIHGYYLHGKLQPHNWTHGCLCDKSESIFNYFWSGSGKNVRGEVPVSVD